MKSQVEWDVTISNDRFSHRLKELLPGVEDVTIGVTIALTQYNKSLYELVDVFVENLEKKYNKEEAKKVKKALLDAFGNFPPKEVLDLFQNITQEQVNKLQAEISKGLSSYDDFVTYIEQATMTGKVHIETFKIEINKKTLLSMSYRPKGFLQLDSLDNNHSVIRFIIQSIMQSMTTTDTVDDQDFESSFEAINELVPNISFTLGKFFPEKMREEKAEQEPLMQPLLFPISKGSRKEDLKNAINSFLPRIISEIVRDISQIVEDEINCLNYLGPLRSYPPRHIAFSQYHDPNWQAGGGYAWDVVRRGEKEVRALVNNWLGDKEKLSTPYELRIRNLLTIDDIERKYFDLYDRIFKEKYSSWDESTGVINDVYDEVINEIPSKLKFYESVLSDVQDLGLFDKRANTLVSHRDVGIGISQVLPVLVSAFAAHNKIVAIEQPEIHLHPRLQAELGDIFINSALGESKNAFILETHSEHLILRIMKRIRETTLGKNKNTPSIKPEDVALLYIEDSKAGSIVKQLRIDDKGRLIDPCPGGFFEEGFDELF